MRYNDVRHRMNIVEGVLEKYWNAIQKKQMIASDGLLSTGCSSSRGIRSKLVALGLLLGECLMEITSNTKLNEC